METGEVQDFAREIQVEAGVRPGWITNLAYVLVLWGLWYFISTAKDGGLEGPNQIFWALLALWLIYTPLAVAKKWFAISL